MKKLLKIINVMIVMTSAPLIAQPEASGELIKLLANTESYSAQFNQTIRDNTGQRISKTHGKIVVKRPGKFYWQSKTPETMLVVADGKYVWTYDIDLAQVTKQEMKDVMSGSPASLLAGNVSHITNTFQVSRSNRCDKKVDQCFSLKPTKKEDVYSSVVIGFTDKKLVQMTMRDALGQDIQTRFNDVKINQNVDQKLFSFVPPKGVDVIQGGK